MTIPLPTAPARPTHAWLRRTHIAFVPGPSTPLLDATVATILRCFDAQGHQIQAAPEATTDAILTTARFGEPLDWRTALMFAARRRFGLPATPPVYTLVHVHPAVLDEMLGRLAAALAKDPPDPADFAFPGLAPTAHQVLVEHGRRGGPILALERIMQAWTKGFRVLLVVGDDRPLYAYHFDLVGAYPVSDGADPAAFYADVVLRIATTVSTSDVTDHALGGPPIPQAAWRELATPPAMCRAGREFGARDFFTDPVRIAELVHVPAVPGAVASQYSEGCFATWEPALGALLTTITGSVRAVDKGKITEDEIAVIVGLRPDRTGALVRHVEGKRNDPPSSEAVELFDLGTALPRVALPGGNPAARVPVVRSSLHGHRGIAAYDPRRVEFAPLDPPYYHYLVSCATAGQAQGVTAAFARAVALRDPADPRQVVFTVLPGHGVIFAEKWVPGTAPYQTIWEYMDAGYIQTASRVPQGVMGYIPGPDGMMVLRTGA
ncbi:MAG TPA: hypothetical protein VKY74_06910 [Chloroflexia bacterium]|nr:hypothetical protein [Chloroflexia bacterium]